MNYYEISPDKLSISAIEDIINNDYKLKLSEKSIALIKKCRQYLDEKLSESDNAIYGINTGFGSLCNVSVSKNDLKTLQVNLVRSHACGMGDEVDLRISKIMMLLKAQSLSFGNSGVALETVQRILDFYNNDIIPVIYQQGSLGASGDLAPLAHLSLALIGEGEVYYKGEKQNTQKVLNELAISPIELQSKEGLALLNGTQFMSAHIVDSLIRAKKLIRLANFSGAASLDAYDGRIEPFNPNLHAVRPHPGQIYTSEKIRDVLNGSQIIIRNKNHVQDPYSFRCIPQVHGATYDCLNHVIKVAETEISSVTDNPMVFPDEDLILSGGNFHGQTLALSADYLAMAMAELGSISERRMYRLIAGERGLPVFLVANPGLNSGFMIPQYTAASVVSQNKQLCTPASIDSISSSNEQEDHVSMGANAATKLVKVIDNLEKILAIELMTAFQALEFRKPLKSSDIINKTLQDFRNHVPFIENDATMYEYMKLSTDYIRKNDNW